MILMRSIGSKKRSVRNSRDHLPCQDRVIDNAEPFSRKTIAIQVRSHEKALAVPFHDRLLESVAGPQCPVIQIAAWLTFFDNLPA
jgi:hypothetical protein